MFGGLGSCFEEDPFFRDPFAAHHEHMQQMMRSFADPFGRDPFLSITDGRERPADRRGHQGSQVALRGNRRLEDKTDEEGLWNSARFGGGGSNLDSSSPVNIAEPQAVTSQSKGQLPDPSSLLRRCQQDEDFGGPFFAMDRMMSNMRNSMLEMQRKFDDLSVHPDAHTFRSSSVMTYSKIGDEPPKVFQASAQTRTAPGGVKETRKALKDSESGLEKMAIGHHIHDRAHVIKKSRNNKTGDEELNQEFINLDEAEAQTFDEEWQKEIMKFKPSRTRCHLEAPKYRSIHHVPKESGLRREKPLAIADSRQPRTSVETLNVKGTHVPIKSSKK